MCASISNGIISNQINSSIEISRVTLSLDTTHCKPGCIFFLHSVTKLLHTSVLLTQCKCLPNFLWNKNAAVHFQFHSQTSHVWTRTPHYCVLKDINTWKIFRGLLSKSNRLVQAIWHSQTVHHHTPSCGSGRSSRGPVEEPQTEEVGEEVQLLLRMELRQMPCPGWSLWRQGWDQHWRCSEWKKHHRLMNNFLYGCCSASWPLPLLQQFLLITKIRYGN